MPRVWNLPSVELMPFSEANEQRKILLVTSEPAWSAVKSSLHLPIGAQIFVTEATTASWDSKVDPKIIQEIEVIYAIGGGLVADAAKYLADKFGRSLVCLPTALSVDAFLTAASGIRKDGCVYYVETKPPDRLILDFETIAHAPVSVRAAGITDVLSIATGSWDWKYADEKGMNPKGMEFKPWIYENAHSIFQGAIDCAQAAGAGAKDGLRALFDCLAMEVQLCNQIGHARPEEGSEHYFAYSAENYMGIGKPHGDLVGPGILIAARLQGQQVGSLEKALKACHISIENIPQEVVSRTLQELPVYVREHNLPYGIVHEL